MNIHFIDLETMVIYPESKEDMILFDNFVKKISNNEAKLVSKGLVYTSDPISKYTSLQIGLERSE